LTLSAQADAISANLNCSQMKLPSHSRHTLFAHCHAYDFRALASVLRPLTSGIVITLTLATFLGTATFVSAGGYAPITPDERGNAIQPSPISPGGDGDTTQPFPPASGGEGGVVPLAAALYWDANGATAGTGGTGTWTTANTWRAGSPSGTLQTWADGSDAHLEGTAGTVTIANGTTVSPVTSFFEVTGYTLTPSSTSVTTLAGSISLSASVNLNLLSAATTADRSLAIGSVTGGAGSGLTLQGAQIASGSDARTLLSQASSSIDVPITISGTGTTAAGFVATATGTGITGTITNNSSFTTLLGATSGNDLTLSSTAVISGTAGLRIGVKDNSVNVGTVTLNAANTYGGGTTLDGGTLVLGNNSALSTGTLTLSNSSTSVLQAGSGARTIANNIIWGGNGTISGGFSFLFNTGSFTSSGSNTRTMTVSNTGGIELAGNVFLSESDSVARSLTINGASAVLISGVITNNNVGNTLASTFTYSGSNTLTLTNTNTYTGNTTVSGGGTISVSSIGNSGASGNVGKGTQINFGGTTNAGTLLYTGSGETTSKIINLSGTTGGATIDQSGTGLLKFTGTNTASGAGIKTLTLQGSTAGTGEISGAIVDNTGTNKTSLAKSGTGTWTLSGTNTYTGTTSVNGGTLFINGNNSAATGAVTVNATGTLGGTGTIGGAVTVSASAGGGGTIAPGASVGTLTLSSSLTFTGFDASNLATYAVEILGATSDKLAITGALDLTNAFDQITFSGTPNGSTTYVLATYASLTGGTFDFGAAPSGYTLVYGATELDLAPVPEPATWIGGALALGVLGWSQRKRIIRKAETLRS
jgi:autotransporter-associated beta strand protein